MAGAGGKGRVSIELVAASCAAVLTVYAAGHWRTREASRSMEEQAQQRRPVRSEARQLPRPGPVPAAVAAMPEQPVEGVEVVTDGAPTALASAAMVPVPAAAGPVSMAGETPSQHPAMPSPGETTAAPPVLEPGPVAAVLSETAAALAANLPAALPSPPAGPAEEAPPEVEVRTEPYWRDGTFTGWGTSRHGDIQAQVVIRDGYIVESGIINCQTRYPCDVIDRIIHQPVDWQSPDVDRVSRATESADAYYHALVNALAEALVMPPRNAAAAR